MLNNVYLNINGKFKLQKNVQELGNNKIKIGDKIYTTDSFKTQNGIKYGADGDDSLNPNTSIYSENKIPTYKYNDERRNVGPDSRRMYLGHIKEAGTVYAGGGNDKIGLISSNHVGYGEAGDDNFIISKFKEAFGGAGKDFFNVTHAANKGFLSGGEGNDRFEISSNAGQVIDGGSGHDVVTLMTNQDVDTSDPELSDKLAELSKLYEQTGDGKYIRQKFDLKKESFKKNLDVKVSKDENGKEVFTINWKDKWTDKNHKKWSRDGEIQVKDVETLHVNGRMGRVTLSQDDLREMAGIKTPETQKDQKEPAVQAAPPANVVSPAGPIEPIKLADPVKKPAVKDKPTVNNNNLIMRLLTIISNLFSFLKI